VDQRLLGRTELRISAFGLGCARIGGIFQGDARGFLRVLAMARAVGITFFDTADMYSQGESEILLGRAFRHQRDRIVIATKAGYALPAQRRFAARLKPVLRPVIRALGIRRSSLPSTVRGEPTQDFSPDYLRRAVEGSLKRLRTDYVDLFQLHSPPASALATDDAIGALEDLKRSGKIRYYGVSVDTVEAGLAALRHPGVSSLQCVLSLLERRNADALLPRARELGVGVIARECLANGLLVKRDDEVNLDVYCKTPEEKQSRQDELRALRRTADETKTTLAALALDYVSALPGVSVSLIGARNVEQLAALVRELPTTFRSTSTSLHPAM